MTVLYIFYAILSDTVTADISVQNFRDPPRFSKVALQANQVSFSVAKVQCKNL